MPKQNNNNKKYSHKSMEIQLEKPHFVFIHGVGGGSWCWYKVKCLMKSYGYTVTCLDLKSAGIDPSDPNKILSFDDYNKPLIDFLSSLSDHEHVILVGHSAGGLSVTDATRKFPNKIRLAVYVAATMLKSGFLTEQDIKDGVPDVSEYGDVYDLEFGLGPDKPPTSAIVKKELQQKVIYHMSPQEDVTLATMLLKPGPLYAFQSAQFREENEGAEKVAREFSRSHTKLVLVIGREVAAEPRVLFGVSIHIPTSTEPLRIHQWERGVIVSFGMILVGSCVFQSEGTVELSAVSPHPHSQRPYIRIIPLFVGSSYQLRLLED
ncbi:hypothetical protein CTI12_AA459030 [Artemisia annua]|uniref:AB hydrolase-1 domain-containing protein n=1 Tax=Artemisia annua TaxID=35608 RepID=A0A2U1LSF7_ARTAN|nr:hypothetical protein CTI12_AA459030 [Artemisia annua]